MHINHHIIRFNFRIQVAVFHNMSTLLTNEEWINKIEAVVLGCLTNQRIEVREKAGQVLGGLIHCNFIHRARQDELLVNLSNAITIHIEVVSNDRFSNLLLPTLTEETRDCQQSQNSPRQSWKQESLPLARSCL